MWFSNFQKVFDKIKSKLSSAPVHTYLNHDLFFMVESDSCNIAIGVIFPQRIIKFILSPFSPDHLLKLKETFLIWHRTFNNHLCFRTMETHTLKVSNIPFTIFSVHRNVLYQKKPEKMTQRLVRWSEFNFNLIYRSGSSNGKPDALSCWLDYLPSSKYLSSSDTPFSVLRPKNFVVSLSTNSDLSNAILNKCKKWYIYNNF